MKFLGLLFCTLQISVQAQEIITLRGIEYAKDRHAHWLNVSLTDNDSFYKQLVENDKNNEAHDAELTSVAVNSGQKAVVESYLEVIYPTENEPDSFGGTLGGGAPPFIKPEQTEAPLGFVNLFSCFATPVVPTVFEPRYVGSTLEVSGISQEKGKYVISIGYENVRLIGWDQFTSDILQKEPTCASQPKFSRRSVEITLTCQEATWQFVGFRDAWSEKSPAGAKVAFFVRVDGIR